MNNESISEKDARDIINSMVYCLDNAIAEEHVKFGIYGDVSNSLTLDAAVQFVAHCSVCTSEYLNGHQKRSHAVKRLRRDIFSAINKSLAAMQLDDDWF